MNLYCICVCPLTQIRQLESSLFYHIGKEKLGSNGLCWFGAQNGRFDFGGPNQFPLPKLLKPASRKKKAHIHTIIHQPRQVLEEKKNRAWLVLKQIENQTVQIFITSHQRIKKYNKSTQHIFYKMGKIIHNIARSKLQTSHHMKIQFKLRNSNKPTKTEHG